MSQAEVKERRPLAWAWASVPAFWHIQRIGLLVLIVTSFFPSLFHKQEKLFFLLFAAALFVIWRTGGALRIHTPINRPLVAFLIWVLITTPFAIDPWYSFGEWRKLVVQALVFYWAVLVARHQDETKLVKEIYLAIAIGTVVLCLVALQDFVARGGTWQDRIVRAGAPNSDYNWLTTYMVIAIPLLIAACLSAADVSKRIMLVLATGLAIVTQLAAYTRAGWLGMAAEGVTVAIVTASRRVLLLLAAAFVSVVLVLVISTRLGYQQQTADPWTLGARMAVWKLQVNEILAHPVTGIGYGANTFMMRFAGYPETEKANGPHSTFLMVGMGSGVPAVVLLLWLFGATVRAFIEGRNKLGKEQSYFLLAMIALVVGFAVRNAFDYMFAGSLAYVFWLLMAVGCEASSYPRMINKSYAS